MAITADQKKTDNQELEDLTDLSFLWIPAGGGGHVAARRRITTITDNGSGFCLVTTAANHGLSGAESVVISGSSVAGYNTTHLVAGIISDNSFETDIAYTSSATGGSWALA